MDVAALVAAQAAAPDPVLALQAEKVRLDAQKRENKKAIKNAKAVKSRLLKKVGGLTVADLAAAIAAKIGQPAAKARAGARAGARAAGPAAGAAVGGGADGGADGDAAPADVAGE